MTDYMKKVASGDPLEISARWYNAVTDEVAAGRNARSLGRGDGALRGPAEGIILVRNDSGADRKQFEILGITDILISPDNNSSEFKSRPAVIGNTPASTDTGTFVILTAPLPKGAIGPAKVFGYTVVQVDIADLTDGFADVTPGDPTQLTSGSSGVAQILWSEFTDQTGTQWALVRFGGGGSALPTGQYQDMVYQMVSQNQAGFDFVHAHPLL